MDTLKIILLLSYLLAAFLSIAGITIALLSRKRTATKLNNAIIVFLFGMLAMCLYDWFIYYENYSMFGISNTLTMRIGGSLIAILFTAWIDFEQRLANSSAFDTPRRFFKIYAFAYAGIWILVSFLLKGDFFYTIKFILLFTDLMLLLMVLVLSAVYMSKVLMKGKNRITLYMVAVTALLMWNDVSFLWGETSVYWGNSEFIREPLDLTIIFWLMVNIATIIFVYRVDFYKAYNDTSSADFRVFDLDERLREMKEQYSMTNRETDILRLIYKGCSNAEIAENLFISKSTVKSHIYNTFRKADVKSRSELIVLIHNSDHSPEE